MINYRTSPNAPHNNLASKCHVILEMTGSNLKHTLREGYKVIKERANQEDERLMTPLNGVKDLFAENIWRGFPTRENFKIPPTFTPKIQLDS
ncbi:hypothetical protein RHMOL_Rhmol04G0253900 [Rhododendron molle]|uniref:Uncharacterized protein n=1 Tax=Rhododendron molle TaxID=49168 RepID=A0ACC0P5Z2_RHOML|nr:hypothetical protein RHMOL_Rhmol04G0253900 [Rhododendron molle]